MRIYPAIDLRGGKVVRLTQGDFGAMQVYGEDPVRTAQGFAREGATWLHAVDLDGAKDGAPRNAAVIRALAAESGLCVQMGGGLRDAGRVADAFAMGVSRVILGTAALRDPAFLREMVDAYGERVAVGVDARDGKVATCGWLETTDMDAFAFCAQLRDAGVRTIIYTDIARDGQLAGVNLDAYRQLAALSGVDIIASGGVHALSDIVALRDLELHGAIIGKALYEGHIALEDAIRAAGEGTP